MNDSRKPLITTLIPTYRRPQLLGRAIRSVLNQSYREHEVRVYDNASGDETKSVVDALEDTRVRYFCRESNIGAMANFAEAVREVVTPYFHLLSDDDLIFPDFFQVAMEELSRVPEAICFVGATLRVDHRQRVLGAPVALWRGGLYRPGESIIEALGKGHPEWTGILFRSEVLSTVGFIDPSLGLAGDTDFLFRVFDRYPIVVSPKPCAIFFCHSGGLTTEGRLERYWPTSYKIIETLGSLSSLQQRERDAATKMWLAQLRRLILGSALKAALNENQVEARQASKVLLDYLDGNAEARLIRIASDRGISAKVVRMAVRAAVEIRTWGRQLPATNQWQRQYRKLVKQLFASS